MSGERAKLKEKLTELEGQLHATYETELDRVRQFGALSPNELEKLIQLYDSIAYLTRLREQVTEKRHRLNVA